MKIIILLLLVVNPLTDIDKIAKVNKAKKEAEQYYLAENYQAAQDKYKYLIDSLGVEDDRALLNLANSQYYLQDSINSLSNYKQLTSSTDATISSNAYAQLGEIAFEKEQYEPALQHYKQALKKNPGNTDARYNYELLKKLIEEQKQQEQQDQQNQENQEQQDQQNQDQQNQEEQDQQKQDQEQQQQDQEQQQQDQEGEEQENEQQEQQEQEDKEGEEKEEQENQQNPEEGEEQKEEQQPQPSPEDKLKELNISEEKAKMILEAMKNNEIQYIQQNKRKAKKKKDPDKPDW